MSGKITRSVAVSAMTVAGLGVLATTANAAPAHVTPADRHAAAPAADGLPFSGLRHDVHGVPLTGSPGGPVSGVSEVQAVILKIFTDCPW
jgi:hypothetical protein